MGAKYRINSIPALILVGKDGKVAAVNCRGKKLGEELEKMLSGTARGTAAPGSEALGDQPQEVGSVGGTSRPRSQR